MKVFKKSKSKSKPCQTKKLVDIPLLKIKLLEFQLLK